MPSLTKVGNRNLMFIQLSGAPPANMYELDSPSLREKIRSEIRKKDSTGFIHGDFKVICEPGRLNDLDAQFGHKPRSQNVVYFEKWGELLRLVTSEIICEEESSNRQDTQISIIKKDIRNRIEELKTLDRTLARHCEQIAKVIGDSLMIMLPKHMEFSVPYALVSLESPSLQFSSERDAMIHRITEDIQSDLDISGMESLIKEELEASGYADWDDSHYVYTLPTTGIFYSGYSIRDLSLLDLTRYYFEFRDRFFTGSNKGRDLLATRSAQNLESHFGLKLLGGEEDIRARVTRDIETSVLRTEFSGTDTAKIPAPWFYSDSVIVESKDTKLVVGTALGNITYYRGDYPVKYWNFLKENIGPQWSYDDYSRSRVKAVKILSALLELTYRPEDANIDLEIITSRLGHLFDKELGILFSTEELKVGK